ncbi:hypothetical protein BDZ45DRAFT_692580 [Acephala macrosclerotiorum]|nr:hypothetical protein BDZ45DRAFT_692580 [Acephala macrosclerotiorum]
MDIRRKLLIRLRFAPASCVFLSGVRAPYIRYDKNIESWGVMNHFVSTSSNQAYLKQILADVAAQQALFDLSVPRAFRSHTETGDKVYFQLQSDDYMKMRNRLVDSLGEALVFDTPTKNDRTRSPGTRAGRIIRRSEALGIDADPRPRILLMGKTDPETAGRCVAELNKAHPNGFPNLRVTALELWELLRENLRKDTRTDRRRFTLVKTFPFLGEASKREN